MVKLRMGTVVPRLHQVWRGRIQLWNLGMESGEEAREGTCGEQKGAVGVHISAARRKHPVVFSCAGVAALWGSASQGQRRCYGTRLFPIRAKEPGLRSRSPSLLTPVSTSPFPLPFLCRTNSQTYTITSFLVSDVLCLSYKIVL